MIDPNIFYACVVISAALGFLLGFTLLSSGQFSVGSRVFLGLLLMVFISGFMAVILDSASASQNATVTNMSSKIVDNYDGGDMLLYHDLSIKLETGKIIYFDEPYEWKEFKVGSYYNYTRLDFRSYIRGQSFSYDYDYIGVI